MQKYNRIGDQFDKGFAAACVIASFATLILFAANAPLKYVERERQSSGAFRLSSSRIFRESEMPTMAGWPVRYLIEYPDETTARYFSWPSLVANMIIAIAVGWILFFMLRFRDQQLQRASPLFCFRTKRSFDAIFACLIFLLPMIFLGTSWGLSERQRRLLRDVSSDANVESSCWYPKLFADKIPSILSPCFKKPRGVEFIRAEADQIISATRLPELVSVGFYGSEIPDDFFQQVSGRQHLSSLSLVGQTLDENCIDSIAGLSHIKRLRINRSNLDAKLLNRLSHWTNLRSLDVADNPIALSNFRRPAWSKTVTKLSLPRPEVGSGDEITIEGWPHLKTLCIRSQSIKINKSTLGVRLANLPELESLLLDRYQKHRLDLSDLPNLDSIDDFPEGQHRLTFRNVWIPGGCWVESVRLVRLPSLTHCRFYVTELKSFEIDEIPNCKKMVLSCELIAAKGWIQKKVDDQVDFQNLIRAFGENTPSECSGPSTLAFRSVPLSGLDLSPLLSNTAIQKLAFRGCRIQADQVRPETPRQHLAELDLGNCVLNEVQLQRLLSDFPKLETLRASGKELKEVSLVRPNYLKKLQLGGLDNIQSFRLVDQHRLSTELRFRESPSTLIIKNTESLLGIVIEKPMKPGASISGLRNLQWFAAGGPEVNDPIVQQVLMCPDLDRLTLVYPNLSRPMLRQIGQAKHLTALIVPGAGVDQDITDSWEPLRSLWEINLDENQIGGRTIRWLSQNESLRSVSFAKAKIQSEALNSLHLLHRITDLTLSQAQADRSSLITLLAFGSLERLDLSGCQINDQILNGLANSRALTAVKLYGCNVSSSQIKTLQSAKPKLRIVTKDEPLRGLQRSDLTDGEVEAEIGMEIWRNPTKPRRQRSRNARESVFHSNATPSVGDALDLNHFRG
jgi:hypothetical protein